MLFFRVRGVSCELCRTDLFIRLTVLAARDVQKHIAMPETQTLRRARRQGKSASTQAGEFVREEIHHVREGIHGARSARQAIAIGLSRARRAGIRLPPPKTGRASERVRQRALRD